MKPIIGLASSTPSRRRIVGLTVSVRSLPAAVDRLDRERIEFRRTKGTGWSSVTVDGPLAHGIRLEFREYSQGRP